MSFVSAIFLFALPLVAAPIAIHLYRGRQRDTIEWGAMQFLAEAVTKGRRMERLEELLLMFLRVGTVLALILALAQPMLRSSLFGSSENREVVLIIDNSLSMAREVEGELASDRMKEQVGELLDDLTAESRVQILLACGGPQWLTLEGIAADLSGKQQLQVLLDDVEPTLGDADLLASLQMAMNLEAVDSPSARRIVLFTDGQQQSWRLESKHAWAQLQQARQDAKLPTSIELVDCGFEEAPFENLCVSALEASRMRVRPGDSIRLSATVANVGDERSAEATVEWMLAGEVVETSMLKSLESGESTNVAVTLPFAEAGVVAVSCSLNAVDEILLDQTESLVIEVSDRLPILIVHDLERDFSDNTADELLRIALGYDGDQALKWHSVYEPEVINPSELVDVALANYRVVIITNLGDIDGQERERLSNYVHSGGGLWMSLGDRIDTVEFNRDWYDDGQGLSPLVLHGLRTAAEEDDPGSMIHPPSHEHPATVSLANTTQLDIDQARVYEYWEFIQPEETDKNVSAVLEAGDGTPLVVENYFGQGRVLVQAFPIGLEQSNLPQLKCFLVMVHDWLDYLSAPSTARYNLSPGASLTATVPIEDGATEAIAYTPMNDAVPLVVQEVDGLSVARFSQTQLPGLYRVSLTHGDEIIATRPFAVSRNPEESRWRPLEDQQRDHLASLANLQFDGTQSIELAEIEPLPRQEPLWGLLLSLLIILFGGEFLLSHLLGQQRGVPVTVR